MMDIVFTQGDDVLGFVPLHQAYDCAKALSIAFKNSLESISKRLKAAQSPTLSVGLAIAHHMTPLSVVREYASQAEKYAKGDHIIDPNKRRNALGILLMYVQEIKLNYVLVGIKLMHIKLLMNG